MENLKAEIGAGAGPAPIHFSAKTVAGLATTTLAGWAAGRNGLGYFLSRTLVPPDASSAYLFRHQSFVFYNILALFRRF